jgi:MerR family copper efflux transcriptional regulator
MAQFGVSELAKQAGVAPSTVRFYERIGLLAPVARGTNGYRVFDEASLTDLTFIARAKSIGMGLDEIRELLSEWPTGECHLLQTRLRVFLTERIDQVHAQIGELVAFEDQLTGVLGRLSQRAPGPEQCGHGCGCEADLDPRRRPDPPADGVDLPAPRRAARPRRPLAQPR